MTKTRHLIASAPIAIAAMATLHTTTATAQEAPTIVLDVSAAEPTTAPVTASSPAPIVIDVPQQAPVAIDIPDFEPVVEAPVSSEPVAAAVARTTSAPAVQSESVPTANVASESESSPPATVAIPETPAALDTAAQTAPLAAAQIEPVSDPIQDSSSAALLFALLGVGGIGLAAFLLFRSRRRRRTNEAPVIERPIPAARPAMDRDPQVTTFDAEPVHVAAVEPSRLVAGSDGAAVELPAQLPASRAERGTLLQRMIAARPDRANPFASHKARAKRARLILQSIGTRFTNRKPSIDLSQYSNVWPELRGWRPATA